MKKKDVSEKGSKAAQCITKRTKIKMASNAHPGYLEHSI